MAVIIIIIMTVRNVITINKTVLRLMYDFIIVFTPNIYFIHIFNLIQIK